MRSTYHAGKWYKDIASHKAKLNINGNKVELKNPEERFEVLDRDCCLLFENLFSAEGKGLEINDEILNIFKEHPKLSSRVNTITSRYFIFGKDNRKYAIGRQGSGLKFKGPLSNKLLNCILKRIQNVEKTTITSTEAQKLDICR